MALRLIPWLLSIALHAATVLAFYDFAPSAAIEEGAGEDRFVIEQGVAIEGLSTGPDEETVEAVEVPPQEESRAQSRLEEIKPQEKPVTEAPVQEQVIEEEPIEPLEPEEPLPEDMKVAELPEETEIIDSVQGPEAEALKMRTPEPVQEEMEIEEVKPPQPEQLAAVEQLQVLPVEEKQASGETQQGGDPSKRRAYFGELLKHLQKRKVNPHTSNKGTVVVEMTVDPSGKVLNRKVTQSSGIERLDEAAVASIDRSSPFPPFDQGVSGEPLVVHVPFKFLVR